MKAFEARKESIQPQYDSAMKDIERAVEWGWKSTRVGYGTLYKEVVDMLLDDGFDINFVKGAKDGRYYNEASWENAEEGRRGKITYVDETQLGFKSKGEYVKSKRHKKGVHEEVIRLMREL